MLKKLFEFNEPGFFRNKAGLIYNSVDRYSKARNDSSLSPEDIQDIKNESETILQNIMKDSGFSDEDHAFISIDKEFFSEGKLDNPKLNNFQKKILQHYSSDQLKWIFTGTTSNYSPVTRKIIKEQGHSYNDMLPTDMKRVLKEKQRAPYRGDENLDFQVFCYSDGTLSEDLINEKADFSFDKLHSRSGFNFKSGYKPNNMVKKMGWTAGFNDNDTWEKIEFDTTYSEPYIDDEHNLLNISSENINSIGIMKFPDAEEVFLFDMNLNLSEEKQESFYSITGELYGTREIDRDNSIDSVNNYLKRNNIKQISGFVLGSVSGDTVKYYKKKFKKLVTDKTHFYSKGDPVFKEKLEKLQETISQTYISDNLITSFIGLTKKGRNADELFEGLIPSVVKTEYEVNLNIFNSSNDLETFINLPEINDVLDEETITYLGNISIPENKQKDFSNATQNILRNYNNIFKNNDLKVISLLNTAYELIINEKNDNLITKSISTEKNLLDLINESSKSSTIPGIPSFKKKYKNDRDYYNILNKPEFEEWALGVIQDDKTSDSSETVHSTPTEEKKPSKEKSKGILASLDISQDTITSVWEKISKINIPENKKVVFSKAIQNIFENYPSIRVSNGMTPIELVTAVDDIIIHNNDMNTYNNIRIFFNNSLENIITESSIETPKPITILKDDIFIAKKSEEYSQKLDLLVDQDINTFAVSPLFVESGIPEPERNEIIKHLKAITVSPNQSMRFTRGIINSIKQYKNEIEPKGIDALTAFKSVVYAIEGKSDKIPAEIQTVIKQSVGLQNHYSPAETITYDVNNLDLTEKNDIETFINSPFLINNGLGQDEINQISKILETVSIPKGKTKEFTDSVIKVLNIIKKKDSPFNISPDNAIQSIVHLITGNNEAIPEQILGQLNHILYNNEYSEPDKVTSPDMPLRELNLFNKKDLSKFLKSPMIKQSGITDEQLNTLLSLYSKSYINIKNPSIKEIPIQYRSMLPTPSKAIMLPVDAGNASYTSKTDAFNTAWVFTQAGESLPQLYFTDLGKSYFNQHQQKLITKLFQNKSPEMPFIKKSNSNIQPEIHYRPARENMAEHQKNDNFIFSPPLSLKNRSIQSVKHHENGQLTHNEYMLKTADSSPIPEQTSTGIPQHIQDNFENDNRTLTRSDSQNGRDSSQAGTNSNDEGNKIKRPLDDLFNEFINKIDNNF